MAVAKWRGPSRKPVWRGLSRTGSILGRAPATPSLTGRSGRAELGRVDRPAASAVNLAYEQTPVAALDGGEPGDRAPDEKGR